MKKILICALLGTASLASADEPWKFEANSQENEIKLVVDLYQETVDVPGMEMFGPMNGYIQGKGVYGIWMVTSVKIKNKREATIHLSNDMGSETQTVRLSLPNDSTCIFEQTDGAVIKKAVGRKLVKIPKTIELTRKVSKTDDPDR